MLRLNEYGEKLNEAIEIADSNTTNVKVKPIVGAPRKLKLEEFKYNQC